MSHHNRTNLLVGLGIGALVGPLLRDLFGSTQPQPQMQQQNSVWGQQSMQRGSSQSGRSVFRQQQEPAAPAPQQAYYQNQAPVAPQAPAAPQTAPAPTSIPGPAQPQAAPPQQASAPQAKGEMKPGLYGPLGSATFTQHDGGVDTDVKFLGAEADLDTSVKGIGARAEVGGKNGANVGAAVSGDGVTADASILGTGLKTGLTKQEGLTLGASLFGFGGSMSLGGEKGIISFKRNSAS